VGNETGEQESRRAGVAGVQEFRSSGVAGVQELPGRQNLGGLNAERRTLNAER
jgi:hypothetical protein